MHIGEECNFVLFGIIFFHSRYLLEQMAFVAHLSINYEKSMRRKSLSRNCPSLRSCPYSSPGAQRLLRVSSVLQNGQGMREYYSPWYICRTSIGISIQYQRSSSLTWVEVIIIRHYSTSAISWAVERIICPRFSVILTFARLQADQGPGLPIFKRDEDGYGSRTIILRLSHSPQLYYPCMLFLPLHIWCGIPKRWF